MRITDIDWVQTSMKRTKGAVYRTYEAEIRGKIVQRKTMRLASKTGGYHEAEREWYVCDGNYLATVDHLKSYLGVRKTDEE